MKNVEVIRRLFTLDNKYMAFTTYAHKCFIADSIHCAVFRVGCSVGDVDVREEYLQPAVGRVCLGFKKVFGVKIYHCDILERCDYDTIAMMHQVARYTNFEPVLIYRDSAWSLMFVKYMNMLSIDSIDIVLFRGEPSLLVDTRGERLLIIPRTRWLLEKLELSDTCRGVVSRCCGD